MCILSSRQDKILKRGLRISGLAEFKMDRFHLFPGWTSQQWNFLNFQVCKNKIKSLHISRI